MSSRLVIRLARGPSERESSRDYYFDGDSVTLGGGRECDLQLSGNAMPPSQARIVKKKEGHAVIIAAGGLASKLNGEALIPEISYSLQRGDRLVMGPFSLILNPGITGAMAEREERMPRVMTRQLLRGMLRKRGIPEGAEDLGKRVFEGCSSNELPTLDSYDAPHHREAANPFSGREKANLGSLSGLADWIFITLGIVSFVAAMIILIWIVN